MKIQYFLLALAVAGCSSAPKPSPSSTTPRPSAPDAGLMEMDNRKKESTTQTPLPPVSTVPDVTPSNSTDRLMTQLSEAIQKQDERNIAIASREILIRTPNHISALNALALYYFRKGDSEMAKTLLNKAIATDPNVSLLYSNLAFIYQSQNNINEAIRTYREALKVDAFNTIAAANVGYLYAKQKDYQKAHVALEIAVEKGQRDWKTLSNYGVSLMGSGKYQAAEPHLKKAAELQPQNTEVLLNYAILLIEHLSKPSEGLDVISRLRFAGPGPDLRKKISELENRAKSVLK